MEGYTVLQAHTVLLLLVSVLLTAIGFYGWRSWRIRAQPIKAEQPHSKLPAFPRRRKLGTSACRISTLATEWLAPLIAWIVVLMATLAIIGLMFA
jgi:hypothetical protein